MKTENHLTFTAVNLKKYTLVNNCSFNVKICMGLITNFEHKSNFISENLLIKY